MPSKGRSELETLARAHASNGSANGSFYWQVSSKGRSELEMLTCARSELHNVQPIAGGRGRARGTLSRGASARYRNTKYTAVVRHHSRVSRECPESVQQKQKKSVQNTC